jgi:outer membrane lipoprotein-sorting protein
MPTSAPPNESEAMASFLAKVPRLSVTADCAYDVVQDSGQKIEFGEVRAITLRRPDRARIETTRRDGTHRGLVFDGKQLAAFDVDEKVYATVPKTGTIDTAFDYFKNDLAGSGLISPGRRSESAACRSAVVARRVSRGGDPRAAQPLTTSVGKRSSPYPLRGQTPAARR